MRPVTSRFNTFHLDSHEEEMARTVSPYFYAMLQNKIASYALAVVEYSFDGVAPEALHAAVIEHEKLKAQVIVLEELMRELTPPTESSETPTSDD